jgi:antitoxin component of MazEF toxin-antitoxin module
LGGFTRCQCAPGEGSTTAAGTEDAIRFTDIRVYTGGVKVVKVRRVGNSNVVSIPRELEARGYAPGTSVLLEELESGELRIMPTEQVRKRIRGIGKRVVDEHAEALQILAEHDPDSEPTNR